MHRCQSTNQSTVLTFKHHRTKSINHFKGTASNWPRRKISSNSTLSEKISVKPCVFQQPIYRGPTMTVAEHEIHSTSTPRSVRGEDSRPCSSGFPDLPVDAESWSRPDDVTRGRRGRPFSAVIRLWWPVMHPDGWNRRQMMPFSFCPTRPSRGSRHCRTE